MSAELLPGNYHLLKSSHFYVFSSHLTLFHLNWVCCDWSLVRREEATQFAVTATIYSQTKWGQLRWDQIRWGEMSDPEDLRFYRESVIWSRNFFRRASACCRVCSKSRKARIPRRRHRHFRDNPRQDVCEDVGVGVGVGVVECRGLKKRSRRLSHLNWTKLCMQFSSVQLRWNETWWGGISAIWTLLNTPGFHSDSDDYILASCKHSSIRSKRNF